MNYPQIYIKLSNSQKHVKYSYSIRGEVLHLKKAYLKYFTVKPLYIIQSRYKTFLDNVEK